MKDVNRKRMPMERNSITHTFNISGHQGYIIAGMHEDGTLGEVFIIMAKWGSTLGGLMDAIGVLISIALQSGVPLGALTEKFRGSDFDPKGVTRNQHINQVSSVLDYVFRWLEMKFSEEEKSLGSSVSSESTSGADYIDPGIYFKR